MMVASTTIHLQAVLRQMFPNSYKELSAQLVRFQEMTKLADRGRIGHGLTTQVNAYELPHGA